MQDLEKSEGFAVETTEGLIFSVKGIAHPPNKLIAYLRYVPDPKGDRFRGKIHYRRVYRFKDQLEILRTRYPVYLSFEPTLGIYVQCVPFSHVQKIYDPCSHLSFLSRRGPSDILEEKAITFAHLLHESACIPIDNIGISGSTLLGLHRLDSDIDIVIYGEAESKAVHRMLCTMLDSTSAFVRRPNQKELIEIYATHRMETPLPFDSFVRHQSRKVNEGYFQGYQYFIRFVKQPAQCKERYGNPSFEPAGKATIQLRIKDDKDAIFTPCRYIVEDVVFLEGDKVKNVREIVSFRGRFSDQLRNGERAFAKGSLERVIFRSGQIYHRLTVGGQSGDYIMSLW
jgi:predicted nucleotidyltransferase